jgi:micrococcal nuclease
MRVLFRFLLIVVCTATTPAYAYRALVISVHDGDSVRIRSKQSGSERVRLAGVDAPELAQPLGLKARSVTEQLTLGQIVNIHERGHDRYGRVVADITTTRGVNVSHELVREGLAWWYEAFDPHDHELAKLQLEAHKRKIGIWASPRSIAPWDYRRIVSQESVTTGGSSHIR